MKDLQKIIEELQFLNTTILDKLSNKTDNLSQLLAKLDLTKEELEFIIQEIKKQKSDDLKKINTLLSELKNNPQKNYNTSSNSKCNIIYLSLLIAILIISLINLFI